jgi:hypothetical protein
MPAIPVVIKQERVIVKEAKPKPKPKKNTKTKTIRAPELPSVCSMCGKEYPCQQGNFAQSESPAYSHNYNYVHVCLSCAEQFFRDHVKMYNGDEKRAMRRLCEWLDIYFDPSMWDRMETPRAPDEYFRRVRMSRVSIHKTWDDTLDDEENKRINNVLSQGSTEMTKSDLAEAVDIFGEGFEEKAYEYMLRIYRGYISPLGDTVTAGQLKSARFLAALEYRCMEAIKNDKPNASALSSTLRKSIAESGFDTVVKNSDSDVPPIGVLLQQIEKFTPAQYVKNTPYKDVDKQGVYYDRFCRRPLMNLLNRASQKVDDELSITDEEAATFDSLGDDEDG